MMSLSWYLTGHPPTRKLFAALPDLTEHFASSSKRRKRGTPLRVPPCAADARIVGTAFDYWLRAWIARTWPSVPRQDGDWVAENALGRLQLMEHPEITALQDRLNEVRETYRAYIAGSGSLLLDFLRGCLFLARLDPVCRGYEEEPDYFRINPTDLDDLLALAKLAMQRRYAFAPKERIILNPEFGEMTRLVDGADGDLILDDMLLEIKVSAGARGPRTAYQRQLIGYWILAAMEGRPWPIRRLGVYLARDGTLFSVPITRLIQRTDVHAFALAFLKEVHSCVIDRDQRISPKVEISLAPQLQRLAAVIQEVTASTSPNDIVTPSP